MLASELNSGARGRELGRAAAAKGVTVSYTTLDKIITGTYTSTPGPRTLEALALLSGMPLDRVYEIAERPMALTSLAKQLPADADLLTAPQRKAVLAIVRQFAAANRALHEATASEESDGADRDAVPTSVTSLPSSEEIAASVGSGQAAARTGQSERVRQHQELDGVGEESQDPDGGDL